MAAIPLPLAVAIMDRSVTVRGSPKRPPPAQPLSDKAQQRLMRQAVIQAELEAEEREALKMTAEELRILQESVKSVKAEFSDLDGLSWDTPQAREILEQWHAEQAARARPPSPTSHTGGIPMRRSNAVRPSSPSPPPPLSLSFSVTSASAPDLTPMPSPVGEPSFDDDTIRLPRCVDSRRSSGASTIVPDREDARTPLPSLFASLSSDKENDGAAVRPALPKSHSAPMLSCFTNPFADANSDPGASRPTKSLPPSRIPVRSKSLSAKPSSARPSGPFSGGTNLGTARRYASLNLRRIGGPRGILAPSPARNALPTSPAPTSTSTSTTKPSPSSARANWPANRPLPLLLSASPRRRPAAPPASPSRAETAESESPTKFRIVSAPTSLIVSSLGSAPSPSSPSRRTHAHGPRVASGSSLTAASAKEGVVGMPVPSRSTTVMPGSPVRKGNGGKRVRDSSCVPSTGPAPSPSPTRTRTVLSTQGGVPMRRT
ncbi:hypothetical protein C8Q77DRAFT_1162339 [Trametes polyzona]|nr:hypothetical protein C8Q77DRAFT_1162339 [Trametes polyzona]